MTMHLSGRWAVKTAVFVRASLSRKVSPSDQWQQETGWPSKPTQSWVHTWYFLCLLWDLSLRLEALRSDLHTKLHFPLLTVLTVALNISLPRQRAFASEIHDTCWNNMPVWEWQVTHGGLDHTTWTTTHRRSHVSDDVVSCPEPVCPHAAGGEHL